MHNSTASTTNIIRCKKQAFQADTLHCWVLQLRIMTRSLLSYPGTPHQGPKSDYAPSAPGMLVKHEGIAEMLRIVGANVQIDTCSTHSTVLHQHKRFRWIAYFVSDARDHQDAEGQTK